MSEEATIDEFSDSNESTREGKRRELFGLGVIPTDWDIETLSECVEIIPGNSPPSSTYNELGDGLPFFQGNSEFGHFHPIADTWCSEPRKEAKANDILMSIRAPVGDLNIADRHCCIGRGLAALRPKNLNGLYLFYNLTERGTWLSRLATGSTFKSVTKGDLERLDIPTPPLPEQRKIATVLYTVDQAIEKTDKIIQQYESLKLGVLDDLLRRGIKDHEQTERNIGPLTWEVPESWSVKPVSELAELVHGHQFRSDDFSDDGEVPVLKIGQITESGINLSDADCIQEKELDEYADYIIEKDTPLIALSGATWGKTGYFESHNRSVLQNYRVGKVVTDSSKLDKNYIYYLMKSSIFQKQLRGQVVRQAQENIGKSDFERIRIPVPGVSEQKSIANIMFDIEQSIQNERESKNTLGSLKRALIQDLCSGTVRTTDTNIQVPGEIAQHG